MASGRADRITAGLKKLRNNRVMTAKIRHSPATMAMSRPETSWPKMRFSPSDAFFTPGGRWRMIGRRLISAMAWLSWAPPTRSAWTLICRMRS